MVVGSDNLGGYIIIIVFNILIFSGALKNR